MMDSSVSSNGFAGSVPVVTNPPSGRTNSSSSCKGASRALGVTALLAVLAVGLLFLLPGGPAWAQSAETIEYAENGTGAVATYTAVDPEGTAITSWTLTGTDADAFTIVGGVLKFAKTPDYEMPADVAGTSPSTAAVDNMYEVTVQAMDSTGKTGMQEVTVEVIDVDEPGTVTLSARRPQVGVLFTASVADLDGDVTNPTWQWAKSSSKNRSYTDIKGAEEATYEPTDAVDKSDIGDYLRATVSYTDPEGSGKTAVMNSEYTVQAARSSNNAPKFADDQDPIEDEDQEMAARKVAENTAPGTDIGAPVVATDADNDILTYTLTGIGVEAFDIDWATGQLKTKGSLDFEMAPEYTLTVTATDPFAVPGVGVAENSDSVVVVITVTDLNEPPVVDGGAAVTFQELTTVMDEVLGERYTAMDPDIADTAAPTTWSLAGPDGDKFTATAGDLKFKDQPDYEDPTDANTDNVYEVTVQATDGNGNRGMKSVKVTVMNENEDGVVTLSKTQPRVGIAVTASLTDPDGSISGLTWQWSITGAIGTDNGVIEDANSDAYTPKAGDVDGTLTATASYTDGHDATKTADEGSAKPVAVDTRNRAPAFADQDTETEVVENDTATRKVDENTKADATDDVTDADGVTTDNVGSVVMATDPDPNAEDLTYTLGGDDAAKFRVRANGQIEVGSGTMLDYETKTTYMVTLKAEDSFGASSSIAVTIMVTNVDEAPDVSGAEATEYAENGTGAVAPYTAVDPEGTAITSWTLTGTDADAFTIVGGVLKFAKTPDYEMPADVAGTSPSTAAVDNMYEVTVQAMDSTGKTGMQEVTVEVIDVDEPGTVTLSARRPQVGVLFTASVADLDGDVTNPTWQWAKSSSKNRSYTDIKGAEEATYEPTDAVDKSDIGDYLRATVSYTDPEGSGKTAVMNSEYTVQARSSNNAPKFADDQDPIEDDDQEMAARKVAENTAPGTDIGAPVVATDADNDILTYTLTGIGVEAFDIDWATGQLKTKGPLDFEGNPNTYALTVTATDPFGIPQAAIANSDNSDTVVVVITVTDLNEPPVVDGGAAVTFQELTTVMDEVLGERYTAMDPDIADTAAPTTWSLAGPDGDKFTATAGDLKFKDQPDYEDPTDANTDNVYEVTVQATDGNGNRGMKTVKVTVENVEEEGVVALSKTQPRVGIAVTASLTDPDGSISGLTWQWSITGAIGTDNGVIEDANSDAYTPKAGDVDGTLTATASYTDGHDATKTADEGSAKPVAVDTRNRAPAFADQDTETEVVENDTATRKVDENTKADATDDVTDADGVTTDNVGSVVMATDPDPNAEDLTYTLGGDDAAKFRVRANGQIEVGSGTMLDYETKTTYMVTLKAEDSFGASSSIAVTIMVNDVDEAPEIMTAPEANVGPEFASATTSRTVAENMVAGEDIGNPVAANDANGDALTYALSGTYAASFDIDPNTGQLMTKVDLDFETKASYSVTVTARDSGGLSDSIDVTITVTNVDEMGRVTFWRGGADATTAAIMVGDELGGAVDDSDGNPGDTFPIAMYTRITAANITSWQWAKSMTPDMMDSWTNIGTGGTYTVMDDDAGYYLRATAMYDDGEGSGKNAMATTGSAVTDVDEADRTRDEIRLEIEEAILDAVLSAGIDDAERSAIEQLILEFALTPSS